MNVLFVKYLYLGLTNQILRLILVFFDFMKFRNIFINFQILLNIDDIIICDLHGLGDRFDRFSFPSLLDIFCYLNVLLVRLSKHNNKNYLL